MPAAAQHGCDLTDLTTDLTQQVRSAEELPGPGWAKKGSHTEPHGWRGRERPALQSGLPEAGVGTGLWGWAEGPPLPHCVPWARSAAESRQILQTCPLCPLPISLCPPLLSSVSFSLSPLTQVSPSVSLVSHLHPGPICQDWSPSPCLPPRSLWQPAGSTWPGITVKSFLQAVLGVAESPLRLAEQTAWGWLESHTWGIAGSRAP